MENSEAEAPFKERSHRRKPGSPRGNCRGSFRSIADYLLSELAENPFREMMQPLPGEQVYFIGQPEGPVKIGRSTSVEQRLANMQTGCPVKIEILAVVAGGRSLERLYHEYFSQHRLHGEWFAMCDDLRREIKRHAW